MLTKPELVLKKHFFLLLSMLKTSSAQHNGSKPQLNEISTTQRNRHNTMETSCNTTKLTQHNEIARTQWN